MELDNQELEATRKREKSADELFEELGYEKYENLEYSTRYIKNTKYINESETLRETIEFIFERKFIGVEIFSFKTGSSFRKLLTLKELQAINKKVGELRLVSVESWCRYETYS